MTALAAGPASPVGRGPLGALSAWQGHLGSAEASLDGRDELLQNGSQRRGPRLVDAATEGLGRHETGFQRKGIHGADLSESSCRTWRAKPSARQTAEIVRAHVGAPEVVIAEALRERCFGQWEGSATGNYVRVWAADETDPVHADGNVEPAAAVLDRATALIAQLERQHCGRDFLLVSHGDILQILQAGFSGHGSV